MARMRTVSPHLVAKTESLTVAQVDANTTSEQEFTVNGARLKHPVVVACQDGSNPLDAGLGIVNAYVSAANKIKIRFMNTTGSNLTPGATVFDIFIF